MYKIETTKALYIGAKHDLRWWCCFYIFSTTRKQSISLIIQFKIWNVCVTKIGSNFSVAFNAFNKTRSHDARQAQLLFCSRRSFCPQRYKVWASTGCVGCDSDQERRISLDIPFVSLPKHTSFFANFLEQMRNLEMLQLLIHDNLWKRKVIFLFLIKNRTNPCPSWIVGTICKIFPDRWNR